MTYRIGWVTPLTPRSGIGAFSKSILDAFPQAFDGERIDVTIFYVDHATIFSTSQRAVRIVQDCQFREILGVFDLLVYNIGNNREHHEPIYELLRIFPGIVICHDFVYQHYLADRCARGRGHFASYAALMRKFSDKTSEAYIRRSQITSRVGRVRYAPWDSSISAEQPMSEVFIKLASALVVHSAYSRAYVERHFEGPVFELGMPHDVRKPAAPAECTADWKAAVASKPVLDLVSFGHIQRTKCLDLVVDTIAASATLRRRVRYTIAGFVGDEHYCQDLRAHVEAEGLADIVRFEIGVSDARLEALMTEADLFINLRNPNTEAASLSLVEQLETGKPVVVTDSGCYAEVPDGAALKLPRDVTGKAFAAALEALIGSPRRMIEMGLAGRRHARRWTSRGYAQEIVRCALEHRETLRRRGQAVFNGTRPSALGDEDEAWWQDICRARTALVYLDHDVLTVDPALLETMSHEELCAYVGDVLLGIHNDRHLQRALGRFFARLNGPARYWACVTFSLVSDAVFIADERARERIINATPCLDPEFWAVIERLPPRQFIAVATLILAGRAPTVEELEQAESDAVDGYPARSRLTPLLTQDRLGERAALMTLRQWASEERRPATRGDLRLVEKGELEIEGEDFRAITELSGFHAVESDRVWTRGETAWIGLRLGPEPAVVEALLHPLLASADEPCEIGLRFESKATSAQALDCVERWLRLEIDADPDRPSAMCWLKLTASRVGKPDSDDPRVLGLSLLKLRLRTVDPPLDLEAQRSLAVERLSEAARQLRCATQPSIDVASAATIPRRA